jgi:hypothetical protein
MEGLVIVKFEKRYKKHNKEYIVTCISKSETEDEMYEKVKQIFIKYINS